MANKRNIEIQDHEGNIYNPHTAAKVVFLEDGKNVESQLAKMSADVGNKAPSNHSHDTSYLGKTAKAVDSDKLDGLDSTNFMRNDSSFLANVDLNNYRTPGSYSLSTGCLNKPAVDYFNLLVIGRPEEPSQVVFEIITGNIYYRKHQSSVGWSAWNLFSMNGHSHNGVYEPAVPTDRKRKQIFSTVAPSGTDWDIWYQHE